MAKITPPTASIVTYAYIIEHFIAWYTGSPYENHQMNVARTTGPYAVLFWTQIACNAVIPQLLWKRSFRRSPWALFVVSIFINVGMWLQALHDHRRKPVEGLSPVVVAGLSPDRRRRGRRSSARSPHSCSSSCCSCGTCR